LTGNIWCAWTVWLNFIAHYMSDNLWIHFSFFLIILCDSDVFNWQCMSKPLYSSCLFLLLSRVSSCNLVFMAELLRHNKLWWFVTLLWKQVTSVLLWPCAAVSPCRQDCDTVTTTTSIDTSPTKELTNSVQLPVDEDDYLQPQSSKCSPVIYLDLLDSTSPVPGTIHHCHRLLKLYLKNFNISVGSAYLLFCT